MNLSTKQVAKEISFPVCNCGEDCGCPSYEEVVEAIATAISKAVKDEREACAKVAGKHPCRTGKEIEQDIRARSKKEVRNEGYCC